MLKNHTYRPKSHGKCDPCWGASKGGEYQANADMNSMTKPPKRPKRLTVGNNQHQSLYGGKKPEGMGK